MTLRELLEGVAAGSIAPDEAESFLDGYGFVEIGWQKLDLHRTRRSSIPEVVLGISKSLEQLREIVSWFDGRDLPLLITRVDAGKALPLCDEFSGIAFDPLSGLVRRGRAASATPGRVAVVSAGSSDAPVAEEAAGTLEFFGVDVARHFDCGVAGLHRLFAGGRVIAGSDVLIVVAGMEGALPSVVAGMFRQPVIAVPTSVGYGASFQGLAALLTMLNSCAPGITVVNIDNGFGAAAAARSMLEMARRRSGEAPLHENVSSSPSRDDKEVP
ncbi:MAG: nickel pincer cofactor biosynthesis protein LarB [Thermoanaerobaculia bacterium]